jgi:hypothetical protein
VSKKWLCINGEVAYRKIINCTNKAHMCCVLNVEEYLDGGRHEWENRLRKVS